MIDLSWCDQGPPPLFTRVVDPAFTRLGLDVQMLRMDVSHPQVSGNKWYKLKGNLTQAFALGFDNLLSFGGPHSNHLHALAYAGKRSGFSTIGIVRGPGLANTPTLEDAAAWGMQLVPVSRMAYRDRFDVGFLASLSAQFGRFYLIPEGGSNAVGVQGVADAVVAAIDSAGCLRNPRSDTQTSPLIFCCPLGSGGTLAGMISGVTRALVARRLESCACLGVSALKGDKEAPARVRRLLETTMESCDAVPWRVEQGFHGGGFGRVTAELLQFMREFESRNGLLLDPVYTAKMMFALVAMAREGEFAPGSRLLVLHTGGLQGRRGVPALMQPRTESGEQVDNAWLTSGKL